MSIFSRSVLTILIPFFLLLFGSLAIEVGLMALLASPDTMTAAEFGKNAALLRMYVAFIAFTVLATEAAAAVLFGSAAIALAVIALDWISHRGKLARE